MHKNFFAFLTVLSLYIAVVHAGRDYYDLLDVPRDAHVSIIKKAYRRLARLYHPDKHPGNKSMEAKFKGISEAYEVLSDDQKRNTYDQFGEAGLNNQGSGHPGGFHFHGHPGGGDGSHTFQFDSSMFEDMFGGQGGGFGGFGGGGDSGFGGRHRRQQQPRRRKMCFKNKLCERGECRMVKECKS